MTRIISFCIVLTANTCSLHENLHYHVRSPMFYVKQAMTSTLLLALVAIIFTPYNVKIVSIFILNNFELTYISNMLQIFDNDYVTLTIFSRSFKYIFSELDSDHTFSVY